MSKYNLSEISTRAPENSNKKEIKIETKRLIKRLGELQNLLYAENKHSLLIVLQAMDAAGKDGVIREVFSSVNPMGCKVKPFKKPTEEEFAHDFLWRIHSESPQKGMIQIYNRSHYEDVLIQRVKKWIDHDRVLQRFKYINFFEDLLIKENNTQIIKFYLHISQEEQHERLEERKTIPHKKWKHNPNDMEESKLWEEYMNAYQDCFEYCSPEVPWTIVPSDQNWYKEYIVAKTITDKLESLNMNYPGIKAD